MGFAIQSLFLFWWLDFEGRTRKRKIRDETVRPLNNKATMSAIVFACFPPQSTNNFTDITIRY